MVANKLKATLAVATLALSACSSASTFEDDMQNPAYRDHLYAVGSVCHDWATSIGSINRVKVFSQVKKVAIYFGGLSPNYPNAHFQVQNKLNQDPSQVLRVCNLIYLQFTTQNTH